jgi:hypothetical protein
MFLRANNLLHGLQNIKWTIKWRETDCKHKTAPFAPIQWVQTSWCPLGNKGLGFMCTSAVLAFGCKNTSERNF